VKKIVILGLKFYQQFISPCFPRVCRFYPTCSSYAIEAIKKYGVVRGAWLAVLRIMKCNPFHPGGYDPI
jgi:hypothetical protein